MTNRLVKLARFEYTTATPAVPPQPAYCVTRTVRVPISTGGGSTTLTIHNPGANTWGGSSVWEYNYQGSGSTHYGNRRVTTCYPARQGVPGGAAVSTEHLEIGWEAGARSLGVFAGDFSFSFDIGPGSVGVLCGLAPMGTPVASYNAIQFGVRMVNDVVAVVEYGQVVATVGPFTPGAKVTIYRVGDVVIYQVGSWRYYSPQHSDRPLVVFACLYVSGDYVDNPKVSLLHTLSAYGEWGWPGYDTDYQLRAESPWGWGGLVTLGDGTAWLRLPAARMSSGDDSTFGVADLVLPGLRIDANDDPRIDTAGVTVRVPMVMSGLGYSIGAGDADLRTAPMALLASEEAYAGADLRLPALQVFGVEYDEAPGTGLGSEFLLLADSYMTDPVVLALLTDTLYVGATFDVLVAIDAQLVDYLVAGDTVDVSALITALLKSSVVISDNLAMAKAAAHQYATNLLTGAVGRYEGFDFAGFVRVGMETYGWKQDGLYRIVDARDSGEAIQAFIDFAAEDFETTQRKAVKALFFGADTDGALYARMMDDSDTTYTYRVVPYGDIQRANPAQGLTSRFWRLRLEVVDATELELDSVEWRVVTTGRRTRS